MNVRNRQKKKKKKKKTPKTGGQENPYRFGPQKPRPCWSLTSAENKEWDEENQVDPEKRRNRAKN